MATSKGSGPCHPVKKEGGGGGGIGARSHQDTQDLRVSRRDTEVLLQPCHQPAPAPGGFSQPQLMHWGSGQS